jgi:hypothetical protein
MCFCIIENYSNIEWYDSIKSMQKKSFYCEIRLFAEKIIERMSCE